jgi:hypothetical protein
MMEREPAVFRASPGSMARTCESIIWAAFGRASSSLAAADAAGDASQVEADVFVRDPEAPLAAPSFSDALCLRLLP